MAAARLAAPPRQPPHGSTIPTSLAASPAHNGGHQPRREAQRSGVGWMPCWAATSSLWFCPFQ